MGQNNNILLKIARVAAGVLSAALVIWAFGEVIVLLKGPADWRLGVGVAVMIWVAYRLYFFARSGK